MDAVGEAAQTCGADQKGRQKSCCVSCPKSRNKVCAGQQTTYLALQGLGGMFRSSFELMITGAVAASKQGQSRGG